MGTQHGMVYVLELEDQKYYVGHTRDTDMKRILDHGSTRNSAQWTKLHKPLRILKVVPGSTCDEDRMTLHAMGVYGWSNVRGGRWCLTDMKNPPRELQQNTLLKEEGHICGNCYRDGHKEDICLWNTDKNGDVIFKE